MVHLPLDNFADRHPSGYSSGTWMRAPPNWFQVAAAFAGAVQFTRHRCVPVAASEAYSDHLRVRKGRTGGLLVPLTKP